LSRLTSSAGGVVATVGGAVGASVAVGRIGGLVDAGAGIVVDVVGDGAAVVVATEVPVTAVGVVVGSVGDDA